MVKIRVKKETDVPLPVYSTPGSAGCDLHAGESGIIKKGEVKLITTGLRIFLPEGFEGHVRPRSGLALKHGITVLNTPGTLDEDYRGILKVMLINHGPEDFEIRKGDRIAQLVINKYEKADWEEVQEYENTERKGGFGSTGV